MQIKLVLGKRIEKGEPEATLRILGQCCKPLYSNTFHPADELKFSFD